MTKMTWAAALIGGATGAAADGFADGVWTIGVLGAVSTSEYAGEKTSFGGVPILSYDTDRLHVGFDGLSYRAIEYGPASLSVLLGYRLAPDFPKGALFNGLKKRDFAVEAGLGGQLEFGDAYFGVEFMQDISGAHQGFEAIADAGYVLSLGDVEVDASVGAKYRTAKLNQYLYGVRASEATAARRAFAADGAITGFAGLSVAYRVTDYITATAQIEYEDLGESADSPLVGRRGIFSGGLGVMVHF